MCFTRSYFIEKDQVMASIVDDRKIVFYDYGDLKLLGSVVIEKINFSKKYWNIVKKDVIKTDNSVL